MKQRVTLETSKCIIWTRYRTLTNQVDTLFFQMHERLTGNKKRMVFGQRWPRLSLNFDSLVTKFDTIAKFQRVLLIGRKQI